MKFVIFLILVTTVTRLLAVEYGYDAHNRLTSATYPNGVILEYAYDDASNLTEVTYTLTDPQNDSDGDFMSDGWERDNGLDPFNAADAKEDKDSDGQSNEAEFYSGTDPQDPKSLLKINTIIPEKEAPVITHTVKWASVDGKDYVVEKSTDLKTWSYVVNGTAGTAPVNSIEIETTGAREFYRVRIQTKEDKDIGFGGGGKN